MRNLEVTFNTQQVREHERKKIPRGDRTKKRARGKKIEKRHEYGEEPEDIRKSETRGVLCHLSGRIPEKTE